MTDHEIGWTDLFDHKPGSGDSRRQFRVLKRRGSALLILPENSRLAAQGMTLYPAQRPAARLARALMTKALRWGLPIPCEFREVGIDPEGAFAGFLRQTAGCATGEPPPISILCGNPNAVGRRFIVLVFRNEDGPVAVAKAGIGEAAVSLIEKERQFLESAPEGIPGIPRPVGHLETGALSAMATTYIEGRSPGAGDRDAVFQLLSEWIDSSVRVKMRDLPAIKRLGESGSPAVQRTLERLEECEVRPVLFHGDFAPWNLKVVPGNAIMALDWERGELQGVPGWDWFHYVLQPQILVRRTRGPKLEECAQKMLIERNFINYAERAGIGEIRQELLCAYLFYSVDVLRPTEGLEATRELLHAISSR